MDFKPPRSRLGELLARLFTRSSHSTHDQFADLVGMVTKAGFELTGQGDRRLWPWLWLGYLQSRRPD